MAMKVVSLAGLVAVVLIQLSLILFVTGRIELTVARGFEYVTALLLLNAAQNAAQRGDEELVSFASVASVVVATLTLF
jgi:uncharacterized membrane protein YcaP (DUF421 family)